MIRAGAISFLVLIITLGTSIASELSESQGEIRGLIPEVGFTLGWRQYSEDDLRDTYDGMWEYGIRFSWIAGRRTWFYLAAQYGRDSGNPYYDTPEFEGFEAAHLRTIPLQMGFRWNGSQKSTLRFLIGAALQLVWAQERYPHVLASGLDGIQTDSGWCPGFRLSLGPEWRLGGGNRGIGLEVGFSRCGGDIGRGGTKHALGMTSFDVQVSFSMQP